MGFKFKKDKFYRHIILKSQSHGVAITGFEKVDYLIIKTASSSSHNAGQTWKPDWKPV